MKNEQGFSLIELLIVVAIIAIIAAIAVPSMLQARMAANESGAIQGCRTVGSAEVAFAAVNNANYASLEDLRTAGFVDSRFTDTGFNGYGYEDGTVNGVTDADGGDDFAVVATPGSPDRSGRYVYGISTDQIVRFIEVAGDAEPPSCGSGPCTGNEPIGSTAPGTAAGS